MTTMWKCLISHYLYNFYFYFIYKILQDEAGVHGVPDIDIIAKDQRSLIFELVLRSVCRVQCGTYVLIASICLDLH